MNRKLIRRIIGYITAAIVAFLVARYPQVFSVLDQSLLEETIAGVLFISIVTALELRSPRDEQDD